jgi:hypothetical protein
VAPTLAIVSYPWASSSEASRYLYMVPAGTDWSPRIGLMMPLMDLSWASSLCLCLACHSSNVPGFLGVDVERCEEVWLLGDGSPLASGLVASGRLVV